MDSVDFFDRIDIVEISKKTLIDKKNLNYLKNEEFDKLDKAKGLGFIRIIEREYKVDLSSKKERFLEYLKEHGKDKNESFFMPPPKSQKNFSSKVIVVLLLILITVGIVYIIYANIGNFTSLKQTNLSQNEIVKEAQNISGIEVNETNNSQGNYIQEDNETQDLDKADIKDEQNITNIVETNETNISKLKDGVTFASKDTNKTEVIKRETNKTPVVKKDTNQAPTSKKSIESRYKVSILPKKRIWVGIIDLKTYKKKSYLKDSNITIDKQNDFMLATGHGEFKIIYKDKTLSFNTKNPVRILFRDGNISQIDKKEFIKLNRGKYW